jgi:hypothetical protein
MESIVRRRACDPTDGSSGGDGGEHG